MQHGESFLWFGIVFSEWYFRGSLVHFCFSFLLLFFYFALFFSFFCALE